MDKLAMLAVSDHLLSDPSASAWIFNLLVLVGNSTHLALRKQTWIPLLAGRTDTGLRLHQYALPGFGIEAKEAKLQGLWMVTFSLLTVTNAKRSSFRRP